MKRSPLPLLLIVVIFFGVSACKKEEPQPVPIPLGANALNGFWELRYASGSMPLIHYPEGNGNTYQFDGRNYIYKYNGQPDESGQFDIVSDDGVQESTCLVFQPGRFTQRIDFDHAVSPRKQFIEMRGDTLEIISGCFAYDAGSVTGYLRISHDKD